MKPHAVQSDLAASAPDRARWLPVARVCARVFESALFAVGAGCLAFYAVACTSSSWFQAREHEAFEQALAAHIQSEAHDHSDWSEARVRRYEEAAGVAVQALGRLEVPDARVSVMLLDGTDDLTLNRAVGHIEGTALPGEPGNVGIAGHRDGFFRGLQHVKVGDPISLTTLDGVADYEIESIEIVAPSAVEVLAPTAQPSITLVTCYPFYYVGDAPQRYVVHARQVHYEPWTRSAALTGVKREP